MKIAKCLPKEQKEKPPNQMTRKDWEEIMGMNMVTYKRIRGALRKK